jgi:tetratricopeptide (TPR) repeat protein
MQIKIIFLFIIIIQYGIAFSVGEKYVKLFEENKYSESIKILEDKIKEVYSSRVDNKKIPSGFITMKNINSLVDLKKLFRKRKVKGFFIEENSKIADLHLYAARNYFQLSKFQHSLSHYIQCLRFKRINDKSIGIIYYEIAQIMRKTEQFSAYISSMILAYSMDPLNPLYNYDLGLSLYNTKQRKRSIYHFEEYIKVSNKKIPEKVYLMVGNLNVDINRFLETVKYYKLYLKEKPDDYNIRFALGYICYKHTGDFKLAKESFDEALKIMPETEIFKRSKSYEYKGDIAYNELDLDEAIKYYKKTIDYQDKINEQIESARLEVKTLNDKIINLKIALLKNQNFAQYEEYEIKLDKKGKLEYKLQQIEGKFDRLNPGKSRWNIAVIHEKMKKYNEAIKYYRDVIKYNYKATLARNKIIKLKLKIKRGY